MIFRIDGEIGELLALTPIIREWRRRNNGEKVLVETNTPEVFAGNPDVEEASPCISEIGKYYDMNVVRWRERGLPVAEVYAELVLGDKNLASWKVFMSSSDQDKKMAEEAKPKTDRPVAAVDFSSGMLSPRASNVVIDAVRGAGYEVYGVCLGKFGSWGPVHAAIGMSDLFVGSDGNSAAVAMATDRPVIVCYSYRSPVYFPPYRKDVPFVALVPSRSVCEHGPVCHVRNSRVEYSKFYSQGCVADAKFCCQDREMSGEIVSAILRIGDQA